MGKAIIVFGSGGHAKVIIDILKRSGAGIIGIIDDKESRAGSEVLGIRILGSRVKLKEIEEEFEIIIGIGDNKVREQVSNELKESGLKFGTAIHPDSIIGEDVEIGRGTVVMANAVINSGTRIGEHCIINTSVSIDHDNKIGSFVHFSPGSTTGGTVSVGTGTWIGLGSKVINNIAIGEGVIVGAGSVVVKDIPDRVLVLGVPAEVKKEI